MKKSYIYGILAGLGICIAGALYYFGHGGTVTDISARQHTVEAGADVTHEAAQTEQADETVICVHICGAVASPGVYELPDGSRISDGVAAAGGFSEEADTEYYNLALLLEDGMQVRIPTREEAESMRTAAISSSDGLVNINTAGIDELMSLPGIGRVKAEAIIEYRTRNGPFEDIKDIMHVSGIKESAFSVIRAKIKVS